MELLMLTVSHKTSTFSIDPNTYYAITMVSPFASKVNLVKHIRALYINGPDETRHLADLGHAVAIADALIEDQRVVVCPNPNLFAEIADLAPNTLNGFTFIARRLSGKYFKTPISLTKARELVNAMVSAGILTHTA